MIVCNMDLDNTILYSYKHEIGQGKRNVEVYQNREISFITEKTFELLRKVKEKMLIVPTSTRTIEQYGRIDLGIGPIPFALVCNGGILLVDGKRDETWYRESLNRIAESAGEMDKAMVYLKKEPRRKMELRDIEHLFLFTKCDRPDEVCERLREVVDDRFVGIFQNGEKVYAVPNNLSKGVAVKRFRQYIHADYVVAAGDSEFDISMLKEADKGLAPSGFCKQYGIDFPVWEADEGMLFSEAMLRKCREIVTIRGQLGREW